MSALFRGVYVPVPTPCTEDGKFLPGLLESGAARVLSQGADGLYLCGGTGDAYELSDGERRDAVRIASPLVRASGGKLIVHVGTGNVSGSAAFAEFCGKNGADAVASMPPSGYSRKQLCGYYSMLSKTSGLPVIIYDIPAVTHTNPTAEELLELLGLPGVAGAKISEYNIFLIRQLKLACPDASVFNGLDEVMAFGLAYGADGCIGTWANLFTPVYRKVYQAVCEGDYTTAVSVQRRFGEFLAMGAEFGILRAFEALMADLGYAPRCFRRIRGDGPLPDGDVKALRAKMDEVLQETGGLK